VKRIRLYTDGAARGNPGEAGIGILLYDENGVTIDHYCEYIGTATNNVAEYRALVAGLRLAQKHRPCCVQVFMDSELLVKQMNGEYRVKNEILAEHFKTAKAMLPAFNEICFSHIPREKNSAADRLANKAIDEKKVT